jgi:parvulin-like peptidyl-prolyl isomerase
LRGFVFVYPSFALPFRSGASILEVARMNFHGSLARAVPLAFLLAVAAPLVVPAGAAAADSADAATAVLVRRGDIVITRADWDAELLRIPPKDRAEFAASPRRNTALLERMLTTRELATIARQKKLDSETVTRLRVRQEEERILAAAAIANAEEAAAASFELRRPAFERRARELYDINRSQYASPETVMITFVFFPADRDGSDAAKARAADAFEKLKGGADLGELAATLSADAASRESRGRKGPLSRADMDPSLATAVFALRNKGDIVPEPVYTRDGWYIVRLDERRAPVPRGFDAVKDEIMAELKQKQMDTAREALIASLGEGREITVNSAAVDALRSRPKQSP